jgi:alanine racemase
MNRLGIKPDEALELFREIAQLPRLLVDGVFTQFHSAGHDANATLAQLAIFQNVLTQLRERGLRPPLAHAANTEVALNPALASAHFDVVRCGIALYGLQPGFGTPILSWTSRIAHINRLQAGDTVGYNATYTAPGLRRIAVIPVGWADGLGSTDKCWKEVLVGGKRAPVVGRPSMDLATIDVTHIGPARVGDEVVLIGAQGKDVITAAEAASWLGYEDGVYVTTHISRSPTRTVEKREPSLAAPSSERNDVYPCNGPVLPG